jgi:hypothetical protein
MRRFALYSFVISLLWLGFVCAISFVEAPAKFRALGITDTSVLTIELQHALRIGVVVFRKLNGIEWICAAFSWFLMWRTSVVRARGSNYVLLLITLILCAQTWLFFPALESRAAEIIAGQMPPSTWHHMAYIITEVVKALALGVLAAAQIQGFARAVISE